MEALKREGFYTVDDIYLLPEGERAELIDGKIYNMAPPGRTHQRLSMFLSGAISAYIREKGGACEVYAAPFGVFLDEENGTDYVEPDISVICDPSKLDEKGCHGAPDWVVEIVSPASRSMDYFRKLIKYREAGVREYWVVDSYRRSVTVYRFGEEEMAEYAFGEEIPAGVYEGFSIVVP